MTEAVDALMRELEHNANQFGAEYERMAAANQAGSSTVSNDVVTVTVDGAGTLLSAEFTGVPTDPERWRRAFGDAYVEALTTRRPAQAADEVPGLLIGPDPQGPLAPEQDITRARIEAMVREAARTTTPVSDLTRQATVDGVTVVVNGMRVIVDATATRPAVESGIPLDAPVMAAYQQAAAQIDALVLDPMEGDR